MNSPTERIATFVEALDTVLKQGSKLRKHLRAETETLDLLAARGRTLAEPVRADRDQPPFDRSTRDGFAVRAEPFASGAALKVVGVLRAGELWTGPRMGEHDAVQIMTGAPLPHGANAVAMVEHVVTGGGAIRIAAGRELKAGDNIVKRGSEAHAGTIVLQTGWKVGGAEIAMAAMCGCSQLTVYRRPRVAIVATGDELVEVSQTPGPQQIRNSNSYALAALIEAAGGEPVRLPITPDRREAVQASIAEARKADLIVLSGGVSMGEYDLVEEMLTAAGAEFFFTGVKMQPGKPVVFGRLPATGGSSERYFFGLPGNPISTQVTFHCFVEPLLCALCGGDPREPGWVMATLIEEVEARAGLTRLLPARMDGVEVRLVGWQGSGDLAANARANGYALLLPGSSYKPGDMVRVLLR